MMFLRQLIILVAVCGCYCDREASKQWLKQLPWAARDNLLFVQHHLNVEKLTGPPIPLYRPDLGEQIAYWLIRYNENQFAIISAGEHTGDNMLIMQGEEPSPVRSLQQRAAVENNATCLRYILLTPSPDLNMACHTQHGRLTERPLVPGENVTSLWRELTADNDNDNDGDRAENGTLHLHIISAMQPARFPVSGVRDCRIRSLGSSNGTEVGVDVLCKVLGVCDQHGRVQIKRTTSYGEIYVHLEPLIEDHMLAGLDHDLHFEVVGTHEQHGRVIKGYAVEPSHRSKRQSAYTVYSIDDRQYMPDYDQYKFGKCQIGCGPVAWAQVFGFYDRRAHAGRGSAASKKLFRCGSDGTTGSDNCQAPRYNTDRMKRYMTKLKGIMRTFCLFGQGATYQRRMDDVERFFKDRQGSSADIILHTNSFFLNRLVGIYRDSIRNSALFYIRQKWPVVVGFRVSGIFSQHYAVMTQYRTRVVRKKKCTLWIFCRTVSVAEYDMFVHMGWGGSGNGWRTAKMFMAAVAKY